MPNEFDISMDMQESVEKAFNVAASWLLEEDSVLFLMYPEGGKPAISPIKDCKDQVEVLGKIRNWARDPNTTAAWFIQMSTGFIGEGAGVYSLVAHCVERGQEEGFILFQTLNKGDTGRFVSGGEIDFEARIPNDFFPEQPAHVESLHDSDNALNYFVVSDPDGGVELVLTDACIENDPDKRFESLLAKLTACLRYVHSKDFSSVYPGVPVTKIRIKVVSPLPPTDRMKQIKNVAHPAYKDVSLPVLFDAYPLDGRGDDNRESGPDAPTSILTTIMRDMWKTYKHLPGVIVHPKQTMRALPADRILALAFLAPIYFGLSRVFYPRNHEFLLSALGSNGRIVVVVGILMMLTLVIGAWLMRQFLKLFKKRLRVRKLMNIYGYSYVPRLIVALLGAVIVFFDPTLLKSGTPIALMVLALVGSIYTLVLYVYGIVVSPSDS